MLRPASVTANLLYRKGREGKALKVCQKCCVVVTDVENNRPRPRETGNSDVLIVCAHAERKY